MPDKFKKLIDDNSEEFEFQFDVNQGWNDFKKKKPESRSRTIWLVAASLSLLIISGVFVFNYQLTETKELSEWEEVEMFYEGQIKEMSRLVRNLSGDEAILYDLEQMDKAFAEIKRDLKDDAANEEVIEAMMDHYRLKLSILEKMLEEIRESNEKEDISRL